MPARGRYGCRGGRTCELMLDSCSLCGPATPRCKALEPPATPKAAAVAPRQCTASKCCPLAAGWAWCRCVCQLASAASQPACMGGCGRQHAGLAAASWLSVTPTPAAAAVLYYVQWVEGTVPLYELYTGWQQHRAQRQRLLAAAAAAAGAAAPAVAAPAAQQQQAAGGRPVVVRAIRTARGAAVQQKAAPVPAQLQEKQQQQLRPVELFYYKLRVSLRPVTQCCHG